MGTAQLTQGEFPFMAELVPRHPEKDQRGHGNEFGEPFLVPSETSKLKPIDPGNFLGIRLAPENDLEAETESDDDDGFLPYKG